MVKTTTSKIYCLRHPNVGKLAPLNGKMFRIELDSLNQMNLIDAETGERIWETTKVVVPGHTDDGLCYTTQSGSVYDFVEVGKILPSINNPFAIPLRTTATEEPDDYVFEDMWNEFDTNMKNLMNNIEEDRKEFEAIKESVMNGISERHEELNETMQNVTKNITDNINEMLDNHDEIEKRLDDINNALDDLLPDDCEVILEEDISDLPELSSSTNIFRHIEYGDGYNGTVFHFKDVVTYEQFIRFCKFRELNIEKLTGYAWYEDHPMVLAEGMNDGQRIDRRDAATKDSESMIWTYLWVRAYTD